MRVDLDRLMADLRVLSDIGKMPNGGGITRKALSAEDAEARQFVAGRMRDLGLEVRHDEVGNLRGRRAGVGPVVMTGSHLDTVPSGGWLDGPLGVVGALAAVEAIGTLPTRRPIEVVVFVGEEGSRFPRGTIGSAAISGHVAVQKIWELLDADGISYKDALAAYGDAGEPLPAPAAAESIYAFVELHVEQGGVLESAALPIGAVTAIAGLVQRAVTFHGDANHAGATPMPLRRDALAAAAEWVLGIEAAARELGCVGTVGKLDVLPGGKNIIPGRVDAICDLRAADPRTLDAMDERARALLAAAERRGVRVSERLLQRVPPGPMHERAIAAVERAAAAAGLASQRMPSGAIHDALHMAEICPATMIFVPSIGGRSHCPTEDTSPRHLAQGCEVLARALADLAND